MLSRLNTVTEDRDSLHRQIDEVNAAMREEKKARPDSVSSLPFDDHALSTSLGEEKL